MLQKKKVMVSQAALLPYVTDELLEIHEIIASRGSLAALCGAGSKAGLGAYSGNIQKRDSSYLLGTCSSSREIPSTRTSLLLPESYFSTKLYLT